MSSHPVPLGVRAVQCLSVILVAAILTKASSPHDGDVRTEEGVLQVHLVPHSHCDAGWTSTFEEYYQTKVQYILNTVVQCLRENPERKFNWAEVGYFHRWYEEQNDTTRAKVKGLVASGQLEFLGNGWVQQDEAVAHYAAVIDQMTEGHLYLLDTLGVRPRFGWQIDPFGASSFTPWMFALMGYDGHVIDRVNIFRALERGHEQHLEFVWQPSPSLSADGERFQSSIMTHEMQGVQLYMSPIGFTFEATDAGPAAPPITKDNVAQRTADLVAQLVVRATAFRTQHILIPFGGDFNFYNASAEYENMDQLIHYANTHFADTINIRYSLVSEYFAALHSQKLKWQVDQRDYLPYIWPAEDAWWTGFYTSRAALKGAIRELYAKIRVADVFFAKAYLSTSHGTNESGAWVAWFNQLQHAHRLSGIMQHHDAVTGTAKEKVVENYFQMIKNATMIAESVHLFSVRHLTCQSSPLRATADEEKPVYVSLSNSLAFRREEVVRMDVRCASAPFLVSYTSSGAPLLSQLNPSPIFEGRCNLFFMANVSALGIEMYTITPNATGHPQSTRTVEPEFPSTPHIRTACVDASFSPKTNALTRISNRCGCSQASKQANASIDQSYSLLQSDLGSAYILRVFEPPIPVSMKKFKNVLYTGPLVQELYQVKSSGFYHVYRAYSSPAYHATKNVSDDCQGSTLQQSVVEMEHHVNGMEYPNGHNLISTFAIDDVNAGNTFYSDDSGVQMIQRMVDVKRRLASNVFPSVSVAQVNTTAKQFNILTRQSHGVTLDPQGERARLHFILYRRLNDTGFPPLGLDEALNDTEPINDTFWLLIQTPKRANDARHRLSLMLQNPLQRALHTPAKHCLAPSSRARTASLPPNIHMLTFRLRNITQGEKAFIMVRYQHLYQKGENSTYAGDETVDATYPFDSQRVSLEEMTLNMNERKNALNRWKWETGADGRMENQYGMAHSQKEGTRRGLECNGCIDLKPMEIRSFMAKRVPG